MGASGLSRAQERMWFLERVHPHPSAYNVPTVIRMRGPLDRDALERAIGALAERHATLRSRFPIVGEGPVCEVERHLQIPLERIEPEPRWEEERDGEYAVPPAVERFASQPFDLEAGPLLRFGLMAVSADDHVFAIVIHHLVCDGWSLDILYSELAALYSGAVTGEAVDLAPVEVEYDDHVRRECRELERDELAGLEFWERALAGLETLELPYDRPRQVRPSLRGALHVDFLPLSVMRRLEGIGQAHAGSLFMVLQAAFAILLHRYSGQADVVVGTPVATRQDPDWERLVGLLVNAVVLRTHVDDDESFEELLLRSRETTLDALEHSYVPFESVVNRLQPERSFSRNPLFQVIFSLQGPEADLPPFAGLDLILLEPELGYAHVDLECTTWREPQRLKVRLAHSLDLFEEATARRILGQYLRLLEQISEAPGAAVGSFDLLTEDERRGLRSRGRALDHPDLGCDLAELFDRQAERAPDALALETASRSLSYRQLQEAAERVAASLQSRGAGAESVVAVRASREAEMVVAMLGVIKSGAALLPLDPSEPASRTQHLIADAGARLALTDDPAHAVPAAGVEWITVAEAEAERGEFERPEAAPDHLAYVIYTSGSSGVPKGVLVEHRNAVNTLVGCREWFGFGEEDLFLCIASPTFDIFFFELLSPLISGAAVRLVGRDELFDPSRLGSILLRATVMQAVPSLMKQVVELLEAEGTTAERMRYAITGGDAVPARLPAAIAAAFPRARVTVLYGPTETAMVCAGVQLDDPEAVSGHPIGRPLPNVELRVCDENGELVPVGVAGEICIGGPGVSRGYLAPTPELAARFTEIEGERFYRSGDQGRWRNDGELEFLGRLDAQLKVRGFRIEPGEVEVALESHPNVREAAVVGCGSEEARRLVAFTVLDRVRGSLDEIRERLPPERRGRARILEIGCGDGQLLLELAGECERYVGTDLSQDVLDGLRRHVFVRGLTNVELHRRAAESLGRFEGRGFDAVIVDSLVPYLPDLERLDEVLKRSLRCLRPGGFVFVGGVRNLHPHERPEEERELLVAPDYFARLASEADVSRIDIPPQRDVDDSERYSAVLYAAGGAGPREVTAAGSTAGALANDPAGALMASETVARVRASLAERLPAYMVPASIKAVDSLPTTPNGKVDRVTLEQWGAAQPGDADGTAAAAAEMPVGETESAIAAAWEGVLGISQPARHANFFASGGTSLLAIRVAVRLKSRGIDISAEEMFRHQTIAALAAAVERPDSGREEHGEGAEPLPVSPGSRVSANGRAPVPKLTEASAVLLTGATGFLGVHLLDELLERTGAAVTCLVRGEDDSHARERLAERWAWYFGERELPADRVEVVAGDVGAAALGLRPRRWRSLADDAEHVIHAAADVRHVAAEADVFRTNLEGTRNVIELVTAGRPAALHHVSTIGVKGVMPTVNGQVFSERDLDVGQAATEHYSASKLAAERAVRQLLDAGGAGSILRVGTIAPHSASARFQRNSEDHFLLRYLRSTIELGMSSEWPGRFFALVPVDSLATACVALADVAAPGGDTFHLTTPHRLSHNEMARMLQGLGYPIDLVDPAEFASRAWEMAGDPRYDAAVGGVLGLIDPPGEHVPLDSSWTESKLRELGFEFPRPTASWFLRFVEGCIADGILPAPVHR